MRNPKRIDAFCEELKQMWHRVPDWRFGQLMCNFLGELVNQTNQDVFFTEDDKILEYVKMYMTPEGIVKMRENFIKNAAKHYKGDADGGIQSLLDLAITEEEIEKYTNLKVKKGE